MKREIILWMLFVLSFGLTSYSAVQFAEDLKEQYQADYPAVEQLYTSQFIGSMTVK